MRVKGRDGKGRREAREGLGSFPRFGLVGAIVQVRCNWREGRIDRRQEED
jgi:hypothetical protein